MQKRQHKRNPARTAYETAVIKAGRLACDEDPAATSRDVRLLSMSAHLAAAAGRFDAACLSFRRALVLDPTNAECYAGLSEALMRRSDASPIDPALAALKLAAHLPEHYVRLGRTLFEKGHLMEALAVYREALRVLPDDARIHWLLGDVRQAQGRLVEAIQCYEKGISLDPNAFIGHYRLGVVHMKQGDWNLAFDSLRRGLRLRRNYPASDDGDRIALLHPESPEDDVDTFCAALADIQMDVDVSQEFVSILERAGRTAEATRVRLSHAVALQDRTRYVDALVAYHQVFVRKPDSLRAFLGMARIHLDLGEPHQAIPYLRKALALRPEHDGARAGLGNALHLIGDSEGGWDAFARYNYPRGENARPFEQPVWNGSLLQGKTILLWSSHGRGDVIQFLRYVDFAHNAGGRVIVECHQRVLLPLIEHMAHVERVVFRGAPLPAFDVHAPLYCFPAIIPSSRSMSTTVPYLSADPNLVTTWRNRLQPGKEKTVGICWGGALGHIDAASRFVPLAAFVPLSRVPGIRLIGLQHGPQALELLTPPCGLRVERIFGDSFSVADAAALVSSLDLVITVDTMLAHLAGAMGRPVWTLLRYQSHWIWGIRRDETAWYPTMRLFRQPRLGDWASVVDQVRRALETNDWPNVDGGRTLSTDSSHN